MKVTQAMNKYSSAVFSAIALSTKFIGCKLGLPVCVSVCVCVRVFACSVSLCVFKHAIIICEFTTTAKKCNCN